MKAFLQQVSGLLRDEDGHSLVEYSILLVAIAVACVAIVHSIGGSTNRMFDNAANSDAWKP
jgi:pilus assembly protein Flp/PilA